MDVTPLIMSDQMVIQAYRGGVIRVSHTEYAQDILVFPDRVELWDGQLDSLLPFKDSLDVILCGTGTHMVMPDAQTRMDLKAKGLRVEFMDTGAACRTYNVLLADGRRVVAALMLPKG